MICKCDRINNIMFRRESGHINISKFSEDRLRDLSGNCINPYKGIVTAQSVLLSAFEPMKLSQLGFMERSI